MPCKSPGQCTLQAAKAITQGHPEGISLHPKSEFHDEVSESVVYYLILRPGLPWVKVSEAVVQKRIFIQFQLFAFRRSFSICFLALSKKVSWRKLIINV